MTVTGTSVNPGQQGTYIVAGNASNGHRGASKPVAVRLDDKTKLLNRAGEILPLAFAIRLRDGGQIVVERKAEQARRHSGQAHRRGISRMPVLPALMFPIVLFLVLWALLYKPLRTVAGGAKSLAKVTAARVMQSGVRKWAFRQSVWAGLRPYAPMILVVLIGALAAFGAGFGFVELALRFRLTTSAVYRLDQLAETFFQHARQPGWTVLFRTFTAIGGTNGMWVIASIVTIVLLLRKERASAAYVVVTILGGALLNLALKGLFARARRI